MTEHDYRCTNCSFQTAIYNQAVQHQTDAGHFVQCILHKESYRSAPAEVWARFQAERRERRARRNKT